MPSLITLSETAIKSAAKLKLENEEFRKLDLRLYLSGKGCDGFEYGVSFDDMQAGDHKISIDHELNVICDERTFEFVAGSNIDWVDDERGRGFLVENPNHKKFRGKFYKKSIWKDRLMGSISDPQ